ncbi:MAG: glycosyltransferase family 4 protein [Candidatus Helarchaeota archaeon]
MHILQITPYYPPAWSFGGPVRHVYELSKFLTKKGHNLTVFTTNKIGFNSTSNQHYQKFGNIKVYRFPVHLHYKGYWVTPLLYRYLTRISPDLIHIHSYRNYQGDIAFLYSKLKNIPFVLTPHGSIRAEEEYNPNSSLFQVIRGVYDNLLGKRIIHAAKRLIAVNETEIWHLLSLQAKKSKISIIPNGINITLFKKDEIKEKLFRKKFDINDPFILSVGRLHHIKGFEFLIKAFSQIHQKFHDLKLVIIGEDFGYKSYLINLIQKFKLDHSLILIDKVFKDFLVGAYSAAAVYIQPSKFEIFGMAALEAAACGTPIVVTKVGSFRNLVQNNKTGFTVDYNDILSLTKIISTLLNDSQLANQTSENARKHVVQNYAWNKIGAQIENLYQQVLKTSSNHH